jgi:hypothetical protein
VRRNGDRLDGTHRLRSSLSASRTAPAEHFLH